MSKISSIFVSRRRALMRHKPIIRLPLGVILFLPLSNFTPVTVHLQSYIVSSEVFFFDRLGDYRLSVTCRWRIWKNRMHPQWWRVKDSFLPRYKSTWKGSMDANRMCVDTICIIYIFRTNTKLNVSLIISSIARVLTLAGVGIFFTGRAP